MLSASIRKSRAFSLGETKPVTRVFDNSFSSISASKRIPGRSLSHTPLISASPIRPLLTAKLCTFKRVFKSGFSNKFFNNTLPVAKPPNSTSSNFTISKTYCTSTFFKSITHESVDSFVIFPSTRRCWPGRSKRKLSIYTLPESMATCEERIFHTVSFKTTFVGKISMSACRIGDFPSVLKKRVTVANLPPYVTSVLFPQLTVVFKRSCSASASTDIVSMAPLFINILPRSLQLK